MIARLSGTIAKKEPNQLILDVGGVGYEVRIPLSTFYELPEEGGKVALHIYTYVREDELSLYGFLTEVEREVFSRLLSISGVGPRVALIILSGVPVPELLSAVRDQDVFRLSAIPGIGRKTAERVLLELKDKMRDLVEKEVGVSTMSIPYAKTKGEIVSALINLGYRRGEAAEAAEAALKKYGGDAPLEALLREALRVLGRGRI
ncbi:MAG: Holliday junction branch migration protein RuvA [Acidobacteria bacterium]|nr:Holliday junction branch migration protein RuvA [Acidobacteriota bacterium]